MRNKETIVLVGIVVFIICGSGVFFFLGSQKKFFSPLPGQQKQQSQENKIPSTTLKEYIDSSGLQFSYPEDINLFRKEDTDDTTYAHIQITSKGLAGSILVKAYDDKSSSLDSLIKENKKLADFQGSAKDMSLAGIAARQITTNDSVVTAALDTGVAFMIEVFPQSDKAYWLSAYNTIVKTFSFSSQTQDSPVDAAGSTAAGAGEDVIFEGEEIVE